MRVGSASCSFPGTCCLLLRKKSLCFSCPPPSPSLFPSSSGDSHSERKTEKKAPQRKRSRSKLFRTLPLLQRITVFPLSAPSTDERGCMRDQSRWTGSLQPSADAPHGCCAREERRLPPYPPRQTGTRHSPSTSLLLRMDSRASFTDSLAAPHSG